MGKRSIRHFPDIFGKIPEKVIKDGKAELAFTTVPSANSFRTNWNCYVGSLKDSGLYAEHQLAIRCKLTIKGMVATFEDRNKTDIVALIEKQWGLHADEVVEDGEFQAMERARREELERETPKVDAINKEARAEEEKYKRMKEKEERVMRKLFSNGT